MIPRLKLQIRFADLDILGHVNNSVYLTYFELARLHYFRYLVGDHWDWKKDGMVLVKNEVEYIKPVLVTDNPEIEMKVAHIGTKSFALYYELIVNGVLYTKGLSVQVCYDSISGQSIPIPPQMLEALNKLNKMV
jgi:acyl-CoA thioester hydrolase